MKFLSFDKVIKEKTGLIPDAYFSASKIAWILENVPGAREKAENGELLFGTVDTWLIWKLTNGNSFYTDYTNASRTMLFNIKTLEKNFQNFQNVTNDIRKQLLTMSANIHTTT